jgi:transposase
MALCSYHPAQYEIFIGLDVDPKSYVVSVKDHTTMNRLLKIPANPEAFYNYVRKTYNNGKVICTYEAGPTGFGLYEYLMSRDIDCVLVSPLSIPKAANARVKTNRIDAQKLSQHLKNGDLKPIRVPSPPYQQLRQLIRSREDYAQLLKVTKQRIKSLLLAQSLHTAFQDTESRWSNLYIMKLEQLPCNFAVRHRLNMLLEDLSYARKQNARVLKELRVFCNSTEQIERNMRYLQSIPGVGFIIAATVLGNIGDPENLTNPRELAGFIGLAPSEHSSGDKTVKGPITHSGNSILRSLLVEAAWMTIKRDKRLEQLYHRIRQKHAPGVGARKAIVAVARKLTLIIYRVLKDQREYVAY